MCEHESHDASSYQNTNTAYGHKYVATDLLCLYPHVFSFSP